MKKLVIITLVISVFSISAHAKMYVWVDKDGVKHMSNIPPKEDVVLKKKKGEGFAPPIEVKEDIALANWFPLETKSGFTITGEVKNNSPGFMFKKVQVRATIRDNKGKIVIQREVYTTPADIPPDGTGNFKIENVKTEPSYLSRTNIRFDLFKEGKVEITVPGKKTEKESPLKIEPVD